MAMPLYINLINKQTKGVVKLSFDHALRVLLLEKEQGRNSYDLEKGFEFNGTDIVRTKKPKSKKEKED